MWRAFCLLVLLLQVAFASVLDCSADPRDLLEFSGGLNSWGKPWECRSDPNRHWCLVLLPANVTNPFLSSTVDMALCVQRSCNSSDLFEFVKQFSFLPGPPLSVMCWPDEEDKEAGWTWSGGVIVALYLMVVALGLCCTIVADWQDESAPKEKRMTSMNAVDDQQQAPLLAPLSPPSVPHQQGMWRVFDWRDGIKELIGDVPPQMRHLDLLRTFSILLVVFAHMLVFNIVFISNPQELLGDIRLGSTEFLLLWTALGFRAVDTFFFIGAFLFSFLAVKKLGPDAQSIGGIRTVVAVILHRVLRIAPLYYFWLLVWWFVEPMMADGPMGFRYLHEQLKCSNYGWANFLFINNYVPYLYGGQW